MIWLRMNQQTKEWTDRNSPSALQSFVTFWTTALLPLNSLGRGSRANCKGAETIGQGQYGTR